MTDVEPEPTSGQSIVSGHMSEENILAQIIPVLPKGTRTLLGPGDDCAVLPASPHTLISTDMLVDGQHFRRDWSTPRDIGWRAIMQNAADVAAMGGVPHSYVVAMSAPRDVSADWFVQCAHGMAAAAGDAGIVGGDLTRGEQLTISVTVIGEAAGPIVTRSGARVGDAVVVAGTLGHSAAGWHALKQYGNQVPLAYQPFVEIFRRPMPPLPAGPQLAAAGATAMLDVSDGLVRDAGRIARSSGVVLDVNTERLQVFARQLEGLAGVDPWHCVLHGGEDHALLACLPREALTDTDVPWTVIGHVVELDHVSQRREGVTVDGEVVSGSHGWDHFEN